MNTSLSEKDQTEPSAPSRRRIPEWLCLGKWLPWLVLVAGLIFTWLLWQHEKRIAAQKMKVNFEFRVRRDVALIEQRMKAYVQVLRGVQGVFAASGTINRNQFKDYVETLQLETGYPGIQGVSFALKVPLTQKTHHIAAVRAEGFPTYSIRPEGRRENYVPVIYIEPFSSNNLRVFGYDTYYEPVRRNAMDRACDTGEATLSGKIRLEQEIGERKHAGVLIFLPVYKNNRPHDNISSRRANIIGWIAASIRLDELMTRLNLERTNEIAVEIYDGTEISDKTLLYDRNDTRFVHAMNARLELVTAIQFAGHTWTVVTHSHSSFESRFGTNTQQVIVVAGIVMSLLLTLLTRQLVTSRDRALKAAKEMSQELIKSETRYRTIADFASNWEYWVSPDKSFYYVSPSCIQICGYSAEEFYRDPTLMMKIVHPEDAVFFNDHTHTLSENGWPEPVEFRIITKEGQLRWIAHVCRPVLDDGGSPLGQRASNLDITARKLAEMEIHEKAILLEAEVGERQRAQERLTVKQLQLEELNLSLENRIAESVSKLRRNDQLMILKSRQATMGEMVHNIAHQWRQPLNTLGLIIQSIRLEYDAGTMTPEQMACDTEQVMELIGFMSHTVDDFRKFFHEDKESVCFSVQESIHNATTLISASLKENGIALVVEEDVDVLINGYPNEYAQALLNLMSNAKDVLLERVVPHPVITINVCCQAGQAVVTVSDNAGGITDEVINRIFDPYFTTKSEDEGSGIGLFMSKTIIEEHMGGRLTVTNAGSGAAFRIEVKAVQPDLSSSTAFVSDGEPQ